MNYCLVYLYTAVPWLHHLQRTWCSSHALVEKRVMVMVTEEVNQCNPRSKVVCELLSRVNLWQMLVAGYDAANHK